MPGLDGTGGRIVGRGSQRDISTEGFATNPKRRRASKASMEERTYQTALTACRTSATCAAVIIVWFASTVIGLHRGTGRPIET
jgi:hypothetical protein